MSRVGKGAHAPCPTIFFEREDGGHALLCPPYGQRHHATTISVIACDKREAFAQGSSRQNCKAILR
jgi:hypothetical protein